MPQLQWNFSIRTSDGFSAKLAGNQQIDACTKIEKKLAAPAGGASSTTTIIAVQPSPTDNIEALAIYASTYDDKVTYTVSDESGDGAADIALDGPQLFIGQGAVGLLQKAPKTLAFTNATSKDVTLTIFIGRMVS